MKHHKKIERGLPPEGLWISPDWVEVPVVEHLIALQQEPERFGLSPRDVAGARIEQLRVLAEDLIRSGWTRFRFLAGAYAFEVDNAKRRIGIIENVLADARAYGRETVVISQAVPKREFEGSVDDVYERRIFMWQENPARNRWRFT